MTKITLIHKRLLNSDEVNEKGSWDVAKYMWEYVASGDFDSLEEAFHKSNHIEFEWTDNPEWTVYANKKETRSTSVGDYMIAKENNVEKIYIVASFGFEEVPAVGSFPEGWKY